MPTLTLVNSIVAGTLADAAKVAQNFMNPVAGTPNSFDMINGFLDDVNLASVDRDMLQRHAYSRGRSVGSTLNQDWFKASWFPNFDPGSGDSDGLWQPIAGLGAAFYLPWSPAVVLFRWQYMMASDGADATNTYIKLFVDGTGVQHTRRALNGVKDAGGRQGKRGDRVICGHHAVVAPAAGWHNAGLRIVSNQPQVRIRVHGFRWCALR